MKLVSHFIFRQNLADLQVYAGVQNNKTESREDTKVVREFTKVFLYEKFDNESLVNDRAIVKLGSIFKYVRKYRAAHEISYH